MSRRRFGGLGIASLVMMFCVLCLTIFAILTYRTANSDKVLADKLAESAQNYYCADTNAEMIVAKLSEAIDNNTRPSTIDDVQISYETVGGMDFAAFAVLLDNSRSISVRAEILDNSLRIVQWKEVQNEVWTPGEDVNVFDGSFDIRGE